jgi:hypothetical protein
MEKGFWTRIGTAFRNQEGSWNLRFDYLPTDPGATVQMRPPRPNDEDPKPSESPSARQS